MPIGTFSGLVPRVRARRQHPAWPFEQPLLEKLLVPRCANDPLSADYTDADIVERYLLLLPDEEWDRYEQQYGVDGQPLVSFDAKGGIVINDPLLAAWDAEARKNAGI